MSNSYAAYYNKSRKTAVLAKLFTVCIANSKKVHSKNEWVTKTHQD